MSKPQTPGPHGFRAAARRIFAVALTVISAIAAFAIAGDATRGDDTNWILPAETYAGNRYTNLAQINPGTVKSPRLTWRTAIEDDGGGHLRWHRPYNPAYVILYAVNRGVGLGDGKVFIATQDCHLIALDAAIMAYLLSYDCVTPLEDGTVSFPITDSKLLRKVIVGGTTCPR
jgi:glucose dehydrogenase